MVNRNGSLYTCFIRCINMITYPIGPPNFECCLSLPLNLASDNGFPGEFKAGLMHLRLMNNCIIMERALSSKISIFCINSSFTIIHCCSLSWRQLLAPVTTFVKGSNGHFKVVQAEQTWELRSAWSMLVGVTYRGLCIWFGGVWYLVFIIPSLVKWGGHFITQPNARWDSIRLSNLCYILGWNSK